jgi:hypothetical protein
MADNKFKAPPREKNALDVAKLKLRAPCPTAQGKQSVLQVSVVSNNPRITVYTGDPEDNTERNGYGKIQANMNTLVFYQLLEFIKRAARSKEECKFRIENKNYTWFGGKRSEKPVVISETLVGRDKDGLTWISIMSPDNARPKIRFVFESDMFHNLVKDDGSAFDRSEASSLMALAYAKAMGDIVPQILVNNYVDDTNKDNKSGNSNFSQSPRNTERSAELGIKSDDLPW